MKIQKDLKVFEALRSLLYSVVKKLYRLNIKIRLILLSNRYYKPNAAFTAST